MFSNGRKGYTSDDIATDDLMDMLHNRHMDRTDLFGFQDALDFTEQFEAEKDLPESLATVNKMIEDCRQVSKQLGMPIKFFEGLLEMREVVCCNIQAFYYEGAGGGFHRK